MWTASGLCHNRLFYLWNDVRKRNTSLLPLLIVTVIYEIVPMNKHNFSYVRTVLTLFFIYLYNSCKISENFPTCKSPNDNKIFFNESFTYFGTMELNSCERKYTLHPFTGTLSHLLKVKVYDNWIFIVRNCRNYPSLYTANKSKSFRFFIYPRCFHVVLHVFFLWLDNQRLPVYER